MVGFVQALHKRIVELSSFGQTGGPWEFNLRDIFRWYELAIAVMMRCGSAEQKKEQEQQDSLRDAICTSAYVLFVRRMRTREDRLHLCAEFHRVFGFPLLVDVSPSIRSVRDRVTGQTYLVIGCAKEIILLQPHYTHRNRSVCDALDVGRMVGADAMQGHSKSLESLLYCVSMRWPALLVGPCGSGKRRCVEYLAMQTGHVVEHYSASTATDSTDLLGSFEQVNAYRHLALAIGE
jgi:midasin